MVRSSPASILLSSLMRVCLSSNFCRYFSPPGKDNVFSLTIGIRASSIACPSFNPETSSTIPFGSRRMEAEPLEAKIPGEFGSSSLKMMNLASGFSTLILS